MTLVVAVVLFVAGAALRDVTLAGCADHRRLWRVRWNRVANRPIAGRDLGRTDVVARMVGDPATPPRMLDELAMDLAANEWMPSERLLDQLRRWAHSQLVAERALHTSQNDHTREVDQT